MRFLPNGYQVATGSDDNTVKIWDLRRKNCVQTVPAHTKLISDVKFVEQGDGKLLMLTSSYDNKCKIWGSTGETGDWVVLRTLNGHENKVTSINMTNDLKYILSTSFDRTFKLWEVKNRTS